MIPQPRYAVGDTFWLAGTDSETVTLPCPDCLDTKTWKVITPTGIEHELACPRCATAYRSGELDRIPSLTYRHHIPKPRAFTVRSIEVRTNPYSPGEEVRYCDGLTGGTVCYEGQAFSDEATALRVSEIKAAVLNAADRAAPEAIAQRRFSGLGAAVAIAASTFSERWDAWRAYRQLVEFIEDSPDKDLENKTHLLQEIEMIRRLAWEPTVPALITALEECVATLTLVEASTEVAEPLSVLENARTALTEARRYYPLEAETADA